MKYTKKISFAVVGLVFLALLFFLFKYILAGSFNWKAYSNPEVNFSFRYPSNWEICENFENSFVAIIDNVSHVSSVKYGDFGTIQGKQYTKQTTRTPLTCDNFTMENSRYLVVTDLNEETNETDIKDWIDKLTKANPAGPGQLPTSGLVPVDGMAEWEFIKYVDGILPNQADNTVAESIYFADESKQYLILNNNRIYALKFEPTLGTRALPLKLILKTLIFKYEKNN